MCIQLVLEQFCMFNTSCTVYVTLKLMDLCVTFAEVNADEGLITFRQNMGVTLKNDTALISRNLQPENSHRRREAENSHQLCMLVPSSYKRKAPFSSPSWPRLGPCFVCRGRCQLKCRLTFLVYTRSPPIRTLSAARNKCS